MGWSKVLREVMDCVLVCNHGQTDDLWPCVHSRDVTLHRKTVYRDMKRPRMSTVRSCNTVPRYRCYEIAGKCALSLWGVW